MTVLFLTFYILYTIKYIQDSGLSSSYYITFIHHNLQNHLKQIKANNICYYYIRISAVHKQIKANNICHY